MNRHDGLSAAAPPDLFACRLTLLAAREGHVLPGSGRGVQAAWLNWIRERDPALAAQLHTPSLRRDYTCSPIAGLPTSTPGTMVAVTPEQTYGLRLTGWEARVVARLREMVAQPPPQLIIGDVPFLVTSATLDPDTPPVTFAALAARHLLPPDTAGERQADITLHFRTATSFRQAAAASGRPAPVPFPLPPLVWGGLYDRWQAVAPVQLERGLREALTTRVSVSRFEGASQRVLLPGLGDHQRRAGATGGQWIVGFTGRCTYWWPRRDGYLGGVLRLLAAFAGFAGVGHGTAQGLGQARFVP